MPAKRKLRGRWSALAVSSVLMLMVPLAAVAQQGSLADEDTEFEHVTYAPESVAEEGNTKPGNPTGGISTGPDVTIWSLPSISQYGAAGGYRAYSVGSDSCNIGSENVNWCDNSGGCPGQGLSDEQHPVIAQNLYRLEGGRFEQLGQSWLKHGFFSLNTNIGTTCQGNDGQGNPVTCQHPGSGNLLGVGCTDYYSSSLNGSRPMGLRSEVNPSTGVFPFPYTQVATSQSIDQRIQVLESDIDPAIHTDAVFFVEGQYVVDNDAQAGNGLNNASYRKVNVQPGSFNLTFDGGTVREVSALYGWQAEDPEVEIANVDFRGTPNERFEVGRRITENGDGTYTTVLVVRNMNSDRAARALTATFPEPLGISEVGFHDVDSHSGEAYDTTDWTATVGPSSVSWSTLTFAEDPLANALRWGTMYTYWFDSERDPRGAVYTLELFKTSDVEQIRLEFIKLPENAIFSDGFESSDTTFWQ